MLNIDFIVTPATPASMRPVTLIGYLLPRMNKVHGKLFMADGTVIDNPTIDTVFYSKRSATFSVSIKEISLGGYTAVCNDGMNELKELVA